MKTSDPLQTGYPANPASSSADAVSDRLSRLGKSKDPQVIDKAARDFEAYFVQNLMQEMRKTVQHSDLFGDRHTMEVFESMLDESLGKAVAQGKGLGLAAEMRARMGGDVNAGANMPAHLPIAPPAAPYASGYPRALAMLGPDDRTSRADESFRITSTFGERLHPTTGELDFHPGIDIAMPEGTPVYAAAPGRVAYAGEMEGYGNLVIVDHGNGYTTRYAHNSRLLVEVGQPVDQHTQLSESGSTGHSTGPHLHFEVRKEGVAVDPRRERWARMP